MKPYCCFFNRADSLVADFVVIDARDDAQARVRGNEILRVNPAYISVEIYDEDIRVFELFPGDPVHSRIAAPPTAEVIWPDFGGLAGGR
jgi:hypothetical protein